LLREYRSWWFLGYKQGNKPDDMPVILSKIYSKHPKWKGLSDFLGSDYIRTNDRNYLTYKEAEAYMKKVGLKNVREWQIFRKSKRPINIPSNPKVHYMNEGWESFGVFLGNGNKRNKLNANDFFSFEEAKYFLKKINLKYFKEWKIYKSSEEFNIKIPRSPMIVYKNNGWSGFGDFLGNNNISNNKKEFKIFRQARNYVRGLKLKSIKEFKELKRNGNIPKSIPSSPNITYENTGWISYSDWLGIDIVAPQNINFFSIIETKEFVIDLGLKTSMDWREYKKSGNRPSFISANPDSKYKNEWKGWADFFGYTKREYYSFTEAKEKVFLLDFKKSRDYKLNYKSDVFFPSDPSQYYKDEWKGWADFLGKE
jgi:hypothetical protein